MLGGSMTLFNAVKLEIAMPVAVISALIVGAVLAQQDVGHPAPRGAGARAIEMEEEAIEVDAPAAEFVPSPVPVPPSRPVPKKPNAQRAKREELGTSMLELVVPDGATVWLGRKKLGQAPFEKQIEIVEGRHRIRVDLDDSRFSEWLDVPPGATVTYRLRLSEDAPREEGLAPGSK